MKGVTGDELSPSDGFGHNGYGFHAAVFQADAVFGTYKKRGLEKPMTKSHFAKFLAEYFFGPKWALLSDAELMDFTISGEDNIPPSHAVEL